MAEKRPHVDDDDEDNVTKWGRNDGDDRPGEKHVQGVHWADDTDTAPKLSAADTNTLYAALDHLTTSYWESIGPISHQLRSYNHCMEVLIPNIIAEPGLSVFSVQVGAMIHKITIHSPTMGYPTMYPQQCIDLNETYAHPLSVVITYDKYKVSDACMASTTPTAALTTPTKNVLAASELISSESFPMKNWIMFPTMVKSNHCVLHHLGLQDSGECVYQCGGIFVINGAMKFLVSQEEMSTNTLFISNDKGEYKAEFRSLNDIKPRSTSTLYLRLVKQSFQVELPYLEKHPIPLMMLFYICGLETVEEVVALVANEEIAQDPSLYSLLTNTLSRSSHPLLHEKHAFVPGAPGNEDILEFRQLLFQFIGDTEMGKGFKKGYTECCCEFFPHVGMDDHPHTWRSKALQLAEIVRALFLASVHGISDTRDHYALKRIQTAGPLIALLSRQYLRDSWGYWMKLMTGRLRKGLKIVVEKMFRRHKITSKINRFFAVGNWNAQQKKTGVSQAFMPLNYISAIHSLRKTTTQANAESKNPEPRQLHISTNDLCPVETPEGDHCGHHKPLALLSTVRIATMLTQEVVDMVLPMLVPDYLATREEQRTMTSVWCNGRLLGYTQEARELRDRMCEWRQLGHLPYDTSVFFTTDSLTSHIVPMPPPFTRSTTTITAANHVKLKLHINTCPGTLLHPVLNLRRLNTFFQLYEQYKDDRAHFWNICHRHGVLMLVDNNEEHQYVVAKTVEQWQQHEQASCFTHVLLHPIQEFGISVLFSPHFNYDQSPRYIYFCAMLKSAIGKSFTNNPITFNTNHELCYTQLPILKTKIEDMVPLGYFTQSVVLGLIADPDDQDDAIKMKKSFLDRGGFRTVAFRSYSAEQSSPEHTNGTGSGSKTTLICYPPPETVGRKWANYDLLNADGLPKIGAQIKEGDVILGVVERFVQSNPGSRKDQVVTYQDVSVQSRGDGVVDSICIGHKRNGAKTVQVKVRQVRIPEVGDKFASRHGQKGVMSMVSAEVDLPFDPLTGQTFDITMNEHSIPTRMTVGHLKEMLDCVAAALCGERLDGTAFHLRQEEDERVQTILHKYKLHPQGKKVMYDGVTGRKLTYQVYSGLIDYMRLKHMSRDKMSGRTQGPRVSTTLQPNDGRSHQGGQRFGEMERDAVLGHGAAAFTKERLFDVSDAYATYMCTKCGLLAIPPRPSDSTLCARASEAFCRVCDTGKYVIVKEIPYCFKRVSMFIGGLGNVAVKLDEPPIVASS